MFTQQEKESPTTGSGHQHTLQGVQVASCSTNKSTKEKGSTNKEALLPKTIHYHGKDRLELCGFSTHDPGCKTPIISLKGCDYKTKEEVGHACKDLALKGGATKTDVINLKVKMIADWHLAKGC